MYITDMRFDRAGKNEGIICDKCGQYITNIYTVTYSSGYVAHYGIDCFANLSKTAKLTTFGVKLLNKVLKDIKHWYEQLAIWETITEEEAEKRGMLGVLRTYEAWEGKTFEEYKEWEINAWIPARLNDCKKELARFKKVNFKIDEE